MSAWKLFQPQIVHFNEHLTFNFHSSEKDYLNERKKAKLVVEWFCDLLTETKKKKKEKSHVKSNLKADWLADLRAPFRCWLRKVQQQKQNNENEKENDYSPWIHWPL